jgi:DNA/RNA endonuclease YhcR with UshA esterase domain
MRKLFTAVVVTGLCGAVMPVSAHHSFAAEFDIEKPVTVKGTLTKLEWVNPHGWLHIDVKGPDGKVESWAVEAGGATALMRAGVRQTDFKPGVELTVQGFLAKNGTKTMAGREVKTADGRNFFVAGQQPGRGGQ